ncbi:MAG: OmpW family protein [Alphaproteobacteria bacterium]|nr:OmpW family protein [Alphaproteobacteria bacterium]
MTKSLLLSALLSTVALTGLASVAHADDYKNWMDKERFQIRGRMIAVLANGDGEVNGTSLKTGVDDAYVPEVDLTYFFTKNISAELIAATAKHTVSADAAKVGDTWILPPTLTVQYHFTPDNQFSPYVGAGLNYSWFYGEDSASPFTKMGVDGGLGYAVQAGFDYWINKNWGVNLDVKYIDLNVDVSVNNGALHAYDVDLNPVIVGAGVSYRF